MDKDNQFKIVQIEFKLMQGQMDKYDGLSAKIKTWTVTIWAVLLGWSFQVQKKEILLLSIFIVLIFWWLDAINKNFRQNYKKRRDEISQALKKFFQTSSWPDNFFATKLPDHYIHPKTGTLKSFLIVHIFLLYLPLIIVSLIVFFII